MKKILQVKNLSIDFINEFGVTHAVKDFSYDVYKGETLAIVGESGSGKSVATLSIAGLLKDFGAIKKSGKIFFKNKEINYDNSKELEKIRGSQIAYIFQEPMVSLNPLHKVGKQITEKLRITNKLSKKQADKKAIELLNICGIKDAENRISDYPFLFSGGERQRIMIAMALSNNPELLIADEPTTALDVTIQAEVLDLIEKIKKEYNMTVILITHDMAIVKKYAERAIIAKNGIIIEEGMVKEIFENPKHEYTKLLISKKEFLPVTENISNEVILKLNNVNVIYETKKGLFNYKNYKKHAVNNISFSLLKGSSLGIVGESGSGKTSLIKAIVKLVDFTGDVYIEYKLFSSLKGENERLMRRYIQLVFQDPMGSLNPRMTIEMIVKEGLKAFNINSDDEISKLVDEALISTGLNPSIKNRYPHEFSGGQRQRIAIARAIIMKPKIIIFDEPTSSLDVQTKFQIIELLNNLREKYNLSYIIVSHDLSLISSVCNEVIIMKNGLIVEKSSSYEIMNNPQENYTKKLIESSL